MLNRFDWILPDRLAVGPFPKSSVSINYLRRMGITAILSLTEESEGSTKELQHHFLWQRVPIPDGFLGGIPTTSQFEQTLQILERWSNKGHVIYVHCLAGVGRSPAVCALYLSKQQAIPLEKAIAYVREQHSISAPTLSQIQVMEQFLSML